MEIDPMAKRLLEEYVGSLATRAGLPAHDHVDARLELYSHLYEIASTHAAAANAGVVGPEHVRSAIHSLGSAELVDAAFFAPRRARMERGRFTLRAVAYLIDIFLVMFLIFMVINPVLSLFNPVNILLQPFGYECDLRIFQGSCTSGDGSRLFNRGSQDLGFLMGVGAVALIFAAFEATRGQTPGKIVMGLRTATTAGGPVSWKQAIVRNLVKGFPPLAALDAIIGYLAFGDRKERVSDRYAGTVVVREVR